jgi:muramoyltetrapeptide carboxypeptidase
VKRLAAVLIPVVYKFPFGHGPHKATLPLGVQATLDAETCTLTIIEPALL